MSEPAELSPLARRILAGESLELRLLAADGLAPLALDELLFVQVALAHGEDPGVAARARTAMAEADPRVVAPLLQETVAPEVVSYFARHTRHELLLEAVVRRRDVPPALLEEIAVRLPPEAQDALLLRQDAILGYPGILDALQRNPQLTVSAARRIAEYREHLLRDEEAAAAGEPGAGEAAEAEDLPEVAEIRAAFIAAERAGDPTREQELERMNAARIRSLPLPARLQLTRRAPRALRLILIRDQDPGVALSVIEHNRLTDDEVEQVARSRVVVDEVLDVIARDQVWSRRYVVVEALVRNPKTPANLALRLLPRLAPRSLKQAMWDRNIAEAVREQAGRLYTIKTR